MSELGKRLGQRIRELRTQGAKRWSQQDLARRARITPSYLSMIERGRRTPNLEILTIVAKVLGVPVAELFASSESQSDDR